MTGGKLKLRKGYRETIEAAREYAEAQGATVSFDLTGKHPKIIVERDGCIGMSPFPSTPGRREGRFSRCNNTTYRNRQNRGQ